MNRGNISTSLKYTKSAAKAAQNDLRELDIYMQNIQQGTLYAGALVRIKTFR